MIIYRPHRGGLSESMQEAKEFNTEEEMKQYIYEEHKRYFTEIGFDSAPFEIEDIVIKEDTAINDTRTGWHDTMYVCVKRYGGRDYIKEFGCPQCIGMCATNYPHIIFGYLDKLYFASEYNGRLYVYDKITKLRVEEPSQKLLEVARLAIENS